MVEGGGKQWWQTAPGLLSAVAAVITALAGLLVALSQVGWLGPSEPSPQVPGAVPSAYAAGASGEVALRAPKPAKQECGPGLVLGELADFISFDPAMASVVQVEGRWHVVASGFSLVDAGSRSEAEEARRIIRGHGFTTQCFVGWPAPSLTFFLSNGEAPRGSLSDEDCITFDVSEVDVRPVSGRWTLVDGDSYILEFGRSETEARRALEYVRHHQFGQSCFVGRPGASLVYFKE